MMNHLITTLITMKYSEEEMHVKKKLSTRRHFLDLARRGMVADPDLRQVGSISRGPSKSFRFRFILSFLPLS